MKSKHKRCLLLWTIWLLGLVVIIYFDWKLVALAKVYKPTIHDTDLYYGLRAMGIYPVWMLVGLMFWLIDSNGWLKFNRVATERALAILMSPIFAGLITEVLKLTLRRERPDIHIGHYVFRSFSVDTFQSGGLGLPSSHTAVAFAGMLTLARLYPPIRYVAFALAAGTAFQRVISGAHFPSDVYVGATVGAISVAFTWTLHRRFGSGSLLTYPRSIPTGSFTTR